MFLSYIDTYNIYILNICTSMISWMRYYIVNYMFSRTSESRIPQCFCVIDNGDHQRVSVLLTALSEEQLKS